MKDIIITYIKNEIAIEPLEEIEMDEDLLGNGILDSMGMMNLIDFIENESNISIPQEDMTVENFMTIERIMAYLSKKK